MTATLSLQPVALDLGLYAGDGFGVRFNFIDKITGDPWPLEGTWTAHIYYDAGLVTEFAIDMAGAAEGTLVASLSGEQTAAISSGLWDLQELPDGAEPRTWYRGVVTTAQDITRP